MFDIDELHVDEHYTNDQIRQALSVENLGGIRPSLDARGNLRHVALLTASETSGKLVAENPYHDRIEGDVLLYTAQGREGDQELRGRNKRLIEQYSVPFPIYGFVNEGKQRYRFLGLLELLRHFPELQADTRGALRKVWLFELKIHTEPSVVPLSQATEIVVDLLSARSAASPLDREVAGDVGDGSADQSNHQLEAVRRSLFEVVPYRFEHLIRDLMLANGFRDAQVTTVSADGGIDVDAYVDDTNDFFAGTHVQAQVKRWRHSVGSIEINSFRGALSTSAKGVFVTTSHYTRAAIGEARHHSKLCVTLIDGLRLSSRVVRAGIDVAQYH